MNSFINFAETKLPKTEFLDSKLNDKHISDKDYDHEKIWENIMICIYRDLMFCCQQMFLKNMQIYTYNIVK